MNAAYRTVPAITRPRGAGRVDIASSSAAHNAPTSGASNVRPVALPLPLADGRVSAIQQVGS